MWVDRLLSIPGRLLVKFITQRSREYRPFAIHDEALLEEMIEPCDILLVEGDQWVSGAIKYLTQSTWSHAAIYVGNIINPEEDPENPRVLIEADIQKGVIGVPLSKFRDLNTRICRPIGLSDEDKSKVINYMMRHLGDAYDLKNVFDLGRYLFPTPPVPMRFRRRMIGLGSGDPTRAICSSLIAQAFQSVRYPILPETISDDVFGTLYSIRHHSLFTPRDFDLSPYFKVIKPTIEHAHHYQSLNWIDEDNPALDAEKI